MPALVTSTMDVAEHEGNGEGIMLKAYPVPAKESVTLSYQLADEGHVTITLYNMMGVKVMDVTGTRQGPGQHEMQLSTSHLAAGFYQCRLGFEGANSWIKSTVIIIEK